MYHWHRITSHRAMLETRVLGEQWLHWNVVVPASPFCGTPILANSVPLLKIHSNPAFLSGSIVHLSCQSRSNDERGLVVISPESLFRFAFTFDLPELGLFDELVVYSNTCARFHVTNRDENRA
jgi:hypothetical protein